MDGIFVLMYKFDIIIQALLYDFKASIFIIEISVMW